MAGDHFKGVAFSLNFKPGDDSLANRAVAVIDKYGRFLFVWHGFLVFLQSLTKYSKLSSILKNLLVKDRVQRIISIP